MSLLVEAWVIDFCGKVDFRCLEGVPLRENDLEVEGSAFIRRLRLQETMI